MPTHRGKRPGRYVQRRLDGKGRLERTLESNIAPDGKRHNLEFDADDNLLRETHVYEAPSGSSLAICLSREYKAGRLVGEMYLVKGRVVSRKSYEKARVNFPSMPAPETAIEDHAAELLRLAAAERRGRQAAAKTHVRDPKQARQHNDFCRRLMAEGASADATTWIKERHHTLGEMDESASRRLVSRLMKLGCKAITACKIDSYDDGLANTGHLVVELPDDAATRAKILRSLDRLAEEQGLSGDPDDGQRLCYVKLD